MGEIAFVTGGARSGKSRFAEQLAGASNLPVVYLATMEPREDVELAERIARHRAQRPDGWITVEEPRRLAAAVRKAPPQACLVLDCLSLWVTNVTLPHLDGLDEPTAGAGTRVAAVESELEAEVAALIEVLTSRPGPAVVVTNEVGSGIVPERFMVRVYRDLLGRVNQRVAAVADEAWLLVAGRALPLPPQQRPAGGSNAG